MSALLGDNPKEILELWNHIMSMPPDDWGHEEAMIYSELRLALPRALEAILAMENEDEFVPQMHLSYLAQGSNKRLSEVHALIAGKVGVTE